MPITEKDARDPQLLVRYIRTLEERLARMESAAKQTQDDLNYTASAAHPAVIASQLQATGVTPLNVQNLRGVLADPQPATAKDYTAMPSTADLDAMNPGTLFTVTTGGATHLYRVDGTLPHSATLLI